MVNRALFLDRDGVINYDKGYTHQYSPGIVIDSIYKIMKYFVKKNMSTCHSDFSNKNNSS